MKDLKELRALNDDLGGLSSVLVDDLIDRLEQSEANLSAIARYTSYVRNAAIEECKAAIPKMPSEEHQGLKWYGPDFIDGWGKCGRASIAALQELKAKPADRSEDRS